MRLREEENFQEWLDRVQLHEKDLAAKRIANGENIDTVLEDMSRRIMEKALHPVYQAIKESFTSPYDSEKERKQYEENSKNRRPIADHVGEDFFDNSKNI